MGYRLPTGVMVETQCWCLCTLCTLDTFSPEQDSYQTVDTGLIITDALHTVHGSIELAGSELLIGLTAGLM